MTAEALLWLTIGPALVGAVAALAADAFTTRSGETGVLAASALLAAGGLVALVGGWSFDHAVVYDVLHVGRGYSPVAGVVMLLCAVALASARGSRFAESGQGVVLVALIAVGSVLAMSAADILFLLLALETVAVCAYALVALGSGGGAREAAMKYFVQGAVATGVFVMGLSILAGTSSGRLDLSVPLAFAGSAGSALPALVPVVLIVVALAFKFGAAPLHSWAPDAYEHAEPAAAGVLAGPAKLAVGVAFGSFVLALVSPETGVFEAGSLAGDALVVIGAFALVSVAVGSLVALPQRSYRRMLGYAGVAQAGYALIAVAALSVSAASFHLAMYAIASVCVFGAAAAFERLHPAWDGSVAGLAGLGRRRPLLGLAVTGALCSLAGLPPFGGFWGKFQAFGASVALSVSTAERGLVSQSAGYAALVAVGVAASVVSIAYYGSVIRSLFLEKGPEPVSPSSYPSDASAENGGPGSQNPEGRPHPPGGGAAEAGVIALAAVLLGLGLLPLVTGLTRVIEGFSITR